VPGDTLLCGNRGSADSVTVSVYQSWEQQPDGGWSNKPNFIRRRLRERYIDPVTALDLHPDTKDKKNGFYHHGCQLSPDRNDRFVLERLGNHEATKKIKGKSARAFKLFFRTSSGIDADLSFTELEGAIIVADDGQLLGKITTNSIDHSSVINSIGPYGSSISSTSMFNSIGKYGSDISRLSPFNDITSSPPRIFKGERFIAYLTTNKMKKPRVDPRALVGWLKSQE
jgi:hypothetical protein